MQHFVEIYSRRMGKQIESSPPGTMSAFASYEWPGNIRELQNFIERSVILSDGTVLHPPLAELNHSFGAESPRAITLQDAERDHILKTLEQTRWVVAGPNGAASRLGMKRSTLYFRMQKAGHFTLQQRPPVGVTDSRCPACRVSTGNSRTNRSSRCNCQKCCNSGFARK